MPKMHIYANLCNVSPRVFLHEGKNVQLEWSFKLKLF